ncbi:MAG: lipopolysaccharide heptosyltransferase II [Candidatus Eisenbacteria bacterium]|nr:lipopolysaccharide heptosyltransferase II [Candidatus Eisenbacteria bacterium]
MRPRRFHPESVSAVLLIRLYFIGDVLLSTPVMNALKTAFPTARLSVLVKRRATPVLEGNPFVDEIIEYDAVPRYHSPVWLASLAAKLRRARYDLAVDLTGDLRSSWLLAAADPGFRAGFNHAGCGFLLDRSIPYRAQGHVVDHLLDAVRPLGAVPSDPVPRMYVADEERTRARAVLASVGVVARAPFLALSPGAGWESRRWPAARFGALARLAHERHGMPSVVTGSPSDAALADAVARASGGAAVSVAGAADLRVFAALVGQARAFVGNDSGPMHVAASQGTPVVALFGPGTPERFGPRGAPSRVLWPRYACSPCSRRRCGRRDGWCMESISVERAGAALDELLAETEA